LNYTNRYVFDLAGNRLWQTNVSGAVPTVTGFTYNGNDQLLTDGGFTSLYDANGALTNRSSAAETNGYAYNLRNRLVGASIQRVETGGGISQTAQYAYNASGIRVKVELACAVNGGAAVNATNVFLNDPYNASGFSQVLEELSAMGATPRVSYVVGHRVLSQETNGTIAHLLPDGHGSTRLLTSPGGVITARYSYDAYGKALGFSTEALNPPETAMLYSGEQFDPGLQQYYLRARYYQPGLGRFGQTDPFSPNQRSGVNLYAYCQNDPVNAGDPSGLYGIDVHQFLTRFLARAAGLDEDEAITIGLEAQNVDLSPDLQKPTAGPDRRAITSFPLPNLDNMRDFHFVRREGWGEGETRLEGCRAAFARAQPFLFLISAGLRLTVCLDRHSEIANPES
jgi:RHS repeat-associated protein